MGIFSAILASMRAWSLAQDKCGAFPYLGQNFTGAACNPDDLSRMTLSDFLVTPQAGHDFCVPFRQPC